MGILELLFIAVGLSMDAFAVATCHGLFMKEVGFKKALIVGMYFGAFQALMPLAGYFIGLQFADMIDRFDHWIAFILLAFIGIKMVIGSFKKEGCSDRDCPEDMCEDRECPGGQKPGEKEALLTPSEMLPLAIATSIDALAAGISFAFVRVNIVSAISLIGIIALTLSMLGVKIGNLFGTKFKAKAELAGGIILMLMGIKILIEHLLA